MRAGASEAAARAAANALIASDLQGVPSHGVSRVPLYCKHLRAGRINLDARPTIINERKAAVLIDAQQGLAYEACAMAIEQVIQRARKFGVAYTAVTNSHHYGMVSYHLEPVAAAGMVGLAFGNSPSAMPMPGGKRALFGTNPIGAAFPRKSAPPILIDLSLSEAARGKIMVAAQQGKPIPLGWALDKDGNPTTDANAGLEGMMLAMGGTKGAMLALTIELLTCALAGAAFGFETPSNFIETKEPSRIGQAFLAIDPTALAGHAVYFERVETLVNEMLQDEGVRLPGVRRHASRAALEQKGIVIPPDLLEQLTQLANA